MFCKSCGQGIPEHAQWCFACGTQVTVRALATGSVGGASAQVLTDSSPPSKVGLSISRQIGDELKARSTDAWAAVKLFAKNPVGGLPRAYSMFDSARAMRVGLAFAILYEITFFVGMYLMASRAAGFFRIGLQLSDASAGLLFKLLVVGLVPFASLIGAGALARVAFRGTGSLSGDIFTAGASLLPLGFAVLITGSLGVANLEVIVVLFVFALAYNVLMLYAGCSQIAGIPERGAAPAVPVMLIASAWLTKVIVAAML